MRRYFVETPRGHVLFSNPEGVRESSRPVALMIHGSFRAPSVMLPVAEQLADVDWAFLHLPGHADAPDLDACGLEPWIEAVSHALRIYLPGRAITAIGESVGALVALGLPVARVVAIEPFLTPDTIGPLIDYLARRPGRGLSATSPFIEAFLRGQDFGWVVDRIAAPTLVVGGEPGRSFLSADDLAAFAARPMVRTRRIEGGHALVDHNPTACAAAVMETILEPQAR